MRTDLFYVQDRRQYVGNDVLWWARNNGGYTTNLDDAEVYTKEEALKVCENRETDVMWPFDFVNSIARRAVDMQKLDYSKSINPTQIRKSGGKLP